MDLRRQARLAVFTKATHKSLYTKTCIYKDMYLQRHVFTQAGAWAKKQISQRYSTLQHINATSHCNKSQSNTHPVRMCLRTRQLGRSNKLLYAVPLLEVSSAALAIRIAHHHHALLHASQYVRMSYNKIYDKICVVSKYVVKGNVVSVHMWYAAHHSVHEHTHTNAHQICTLW